jgi:hypothetical protein
LVKDTESPPFVVDGNLSIGRESAPVKGALGANHAGGTKAFEAPIRRMAVEAASVA